MTLQGREEATRDGGKVGGRQTGRQRTEQERKRAEVGQQSSISLLKTLYEKQEIGWYKRKDYETKIIV